MRFRERPGRAAPFLHAGREFGGCGSFDALRLLRTTEEKAFPVLHVILSGASSDAESKNPFPFGEVAGRTDPSTARLWRSAQDDRWNGDGWFF